MRITKNNCFEPTYKELKHSALNRLTTLLTGFEPTYKELKPASSTCASHSAIEF